MHDDIRIQIKLSRVLRELGLGFAEGFDLVEATDQIDTACWGRDHLGHESILINRGICASYPVQEILQILRHEFLHRSVYDGIQERFQNPELANIVLDVVINKILYLGNRRAMANLARRIYPAESHRTAIALANPTAPHDGLPPNLRPLYDSIWYRPKVPNPSSLYYRLARIRIPSGEAYRFYQDAPGGEGGKRAPRSVTDAARTVLDGMRDSDESREAVERIIEEYGLRALRKQKDQLDSFIARQRYLSTVQRAVGRIEAHLGPQSLRRPYPMMLSRLGVVYAALGVSDATRIFWNRNRDRTDVRLSAYIDSSGSMTEHLPVVVSLIEALDWVSWDVFTFDTRVYDSDMTRLKNRRLQGGGGTEFSAPVAHLSDAEGAIFAGVLFTDGLGDVSARVAGAFAKSRKRLFTVVFGDDSHGSVEALSSDVIVLPG